MTRFVLDKNPEQGNISDFIKTIESHELNLIMHSDPFLKTNFLNKLILMTNLPVIYLDFDLLFSGYVASNTISHSKDITIYRPKGDELLDVIKTILIEISQKKSIVIIDSLNGLFNIYSNIKDAGRLVNSLIMLFGNVAKNTNSCILISGMSRRKNNEEWVLSITGRRIVESNQINSFWLERQNSSFVAKIFEDKKISKKSYKIPIESELNS